MILRSHEQQRLRIVELETNHEIVLRRVAAAVTELNHGRAITQNSKFHKVLYTALHPSRTVNQQVTVEEDKS